MLRILIIFGLLMLTLICIGCDRKIDSPDPVRSLPEDGPVPVNLHASVASQSITLSWEVADSSSVVRFRIYTADSISPDLALRDSTQNYMMTFTDLAIDRRYQFRVAAVMTSGLEWEMSEAIFARVPMLSMSIANGAEYTRSLSVDVNLSASSEASFVRISEDSTFADTDWRSYTGIVRGITLSDGDGEKWLYASLLFDDESTLSELLSDDIILDQEAIIESVSFSPVGVTFSSGDTISFLIDAGEVDGSASVSIVSGQFLELRDDGEEGDATADDGVYATEWVVPPNFNLSNASVNGTFTDEAGNAAPGKTADSVLTIFSDPLPVTLSAIAQSTFAIGLSWTEATSTQFTAYRVYRSDAPDVSESSELLETITSRGMSRYVDSSLDDASTYYYRVSVFDNTGLSALSNEVSATTLVNSAPDQVTLVGVLGADGNTVDLSWTATTESDFATYQLYRSLTPAVTETADNRIAILSSRQILSYVTYMVADTVYYQLYVVDRHGLSTGSNVSMVVR